VEEEENVMSAVLSVHQSGKLFQEAVMRYGIPIRVIMVAMFFCCTAPEPGIHLMDTAGGTRSEILSVIPAGTPVEKAAAVMRANGFTCEPKKNGVFLDRTGIDYLYCDRERSIGFMVGRRWQVALVEERGRVMDVLVGTGLIGP